MLSPLTRVLMNLADKIGAGKMICFTESDTATLGGNPSSVLHRPVELTTHNGPLRRVEFNIPIKSNPHIRSPLYVLQGIPPLLGERRKSSFLLTL